MLKSCINNNQNQLVLELYDNTTQSKDQFSHILALKAVENGSNFNGFNKVNKLTNS